MKLEAIFVTAGKVMLGLICLLLFAPLLGLFFHARAKPPANVTNIATYLSWQPSPMKVIRLTVGTNTYWQALGPAGRLAASGPAAYSFDASGKLIGWTPDMGDVYRPAELFGPEVKRETISLSELMEAMRAQKTKLTAPAGRETLTP